MPHCLPVRRNPPVDQGRTVEMCGFIGADAVKRSPTDLKNPKEEFKQVKRGAFSGMIDAHLGYGHGSLSSSHTDTPYALL